MILSVYSIYDEKAAAYLNPFYSQNDNVAIRAIAEILHDPLHAFSRFPSDYTLYYLGEFDNIIGAFKSDKRLVYTLLELRALFQLPNAQSVGLTKEA